MQKIFAFIFLVFLFVACKKENGDTLPFLKGNHYLYVLNEGLFNLNNSSLTLYDLENHQVITDFFERTNGRKLGDTGNDIGIYGSKLYIVVTISSQVEVLEASTGKSIRQIPLFDGHRARQPRALAFFQDKVYVACFDGMVVAIDTTTLAISNMVTAGSNPDGIIHCCNKIYVTNSGGLNHPHYDSTVSVIDPHSMTELHKITVGINPGAIAADRYGDVYVVSRGNYGTIQPSLVVIDSQNDQVKQVIHTSVLNIHMYGDTLWSTYIDYTGTMQSYISLWDVKTKTLLNSGFISDGTYPQTIYGIFCDRPRQQVFISDARGFVYTGIVYCYDLNGRLKFSFAAGINPSKMVIW